MFQFNTEDELRNFIKDNVITTTEAIQILGCSRQYINKLVSEKKLIPIKKVSNVTLFFKSDVEARLK
ncbi:MAG: helix-turn-helix domain-containing protein [Anaerotignaceae bacterium]